MKKEFPVLLIALFLVQLVACERSNIENVLTIDSVLRAGGDTLEVESFDRYLATETTTLTETDEGNSKINFKNKFHKVLLNTEMPHMNLNRITKAG